MKLSLTLVFIFVMGLVSCIPDSPQDEVQEQELEETEFVPDSLVSDSFDRYVIQTKSSELSWRGEQVGGEGHQGLVDIKSGYLRVTQNRITGGEIIVDMTSLREYPSESEETSQILSGYLHSSRFFDTEKYPNAVLKIREENKGKLLADLVIKNQTRPVVIPFDKKMDGESLTATGVFGIDRTKWGIDFRSEKNVVNPGDLIIKDSIYFKTNIVAIK